MAELLCPLVMIGPSLVWISQKHELFAWDQAAYADVTVELWYKLSHHFSSWPAAMFYAIWGGRPPAIAWLGQFFVPLGQLIHSVDTGLLLSILLVQFCTLTLLFSIGKELGQGRVTFGIIMAAIVGSAPLFIATASQFLVEPVQLLATTSVYWAAVKSRQSSFWQTCGYLLLSGSLVVMSKASSPLYCVMPALYAIFNAIKSVANVEQTQLQSLRNSLRLLIPGAVSALISIIWYLRNLHGAWQVVHDASFGALALNYGQKLPFISKLSNWLEIAWSAFALPGFKYYWALQILILLALATFQFWRTRTTWRNNNLGIGLVALAQILLVFTVFSCNIGEDARYTMSLLPSIAIFVTVLVACAENKFVNAIVLIFFGAQFCDANVLNFASAGKALGVQQNPAFDRQRAQELDRLVLLVSQEEPSTALNICGVSYGWLNAGTLNYISAKQKLTSGRRASFDHWGPLAVEDAEKTFANLSGSPSYCFVSVALERQSADEPNFNRIAKPVLMRVQADPRFVQIPFQSDNGIVVFKKIRQ